MPNQIPKPLVANSSTRASTVLVPVLIAVCMAAAFLHIPHRVPGDDVDSGWCAVLDYAREHGLRFGDDLLFTYGPLGFLIMPCYARGAEVLQFSVDTGLCVLVSAGVCLVAWQLRLFSRVLVLVGFICLITNMQAGADLVLELGLLAWGLLCLVEAGPLLPVYLLAALLLAVVCALSKITLLFSAVLMLGCLAVDLWLRRKKKLSVALSLIFCAGVAGGWLGTGQELSDFGAFVRWGTAFSAGYARTMAKEGPKWLELNGAIIACSAAILVLLHCRQRLISSDPMQRFRGSIWLIWLLGLLFISWKHGFVRSDFLHVEFFLGFVALFALLLQSVSAEPDSPTSRFFVLGYVIYTFCFMTLVRFFDVSVFDYAFVRPYASVRSHFRTMLHPTASLRELHNTLAAESHPVDWAALQRRVGTSRIDLFGNSQACLASTQLNYHPRPVFQSYAAYTAELMRLNQHYYLSTNAPKFVLFKLSPIDHRLPALEDARVLRHLLFSYDLLAQENGSLLLQADADPATTPRLSFVREGILRPGELVSLQEYGHSPLWLEIDLYPTVLGGLETFLYKPPQTRVTIVRGAGKTPASFPAPAPMLSAGFLASPLLLRTEDVAAFYAQTNLVWPTAYTVYLPFNRWFWQEKFQYRLYKIERTRARQHAFPDSANKG